MTFRVLISVIPSTRAVDTGHDTEVTNSGYGGVVGSVFRLLLFLSRSECAGEG